MYRLILTACAVPCRQSGWSLYPVLFCVCGQVDYYTLCCSVYVARLIITPCAVACRWWGQVDPCNLCCSLQAVRLIITPCAIPCRWSAWSLHPVLFLAGGQADPLTLYCSLHVFRLILMAYLYCQTWIQIQTQTRIANPMATLIQIQIPFPGTDLYPYYLHFN